MVFLLAAAAATLVVPVLLRGVIDTGFGGDVLARHDAVRRSFLLQYGFIRTKLAHGQEFLILLILALINAFN